VREQVGGRDDQAGRAEPALHGTGLRERLLHRVQLPVPREPLDRDDVVAVGLRGENETRADELAVEQHRARAALALLARVLRARQAEPLAQREEQALALPELGLTLLAVDRQLDPHARHLSSARSVSTRSACRR
jgi:hypothetical protein